MSSDKYLKVDLFGGLCNKLFCLFSAIEIALAGGYILVEPYFGWKEKVVMSAVWNVDKLCSGLPELKWCSIVDFNKRNIVQDNIIHKSGAELWAFSESKLSVLRETCVLNRVTDICCRVVLLLEPATCVLETYGWVAETDLKNSVAVHFRTESDWRAYAVRKQRRMPTTERCFVESDDILQMVIHEFGKTMSIFIVNGEMGNAIKNKCLELGVTANYEYKNELEYEQNACMQWWICTQCVGGFVGLCRSTFSNLVCLRRVLDGVEGDCWNYNYCDEGTVGCKRILDPNTTSKVSLSHPFGVDDNLRLGGTTQKRLIRRVDAGLQPDASKSITIKTTIV